MRAVVQRVSQAQVMVEGKGVASIGPGLMVLLGVGNEDGPKEAAYLAEKIAGLRIFEDQEEKMNLSVEQIGGEVLVVSQFTLYGDCRKGRRPSFTDAAPPDKADGLYQAFVQALRERGLKVETGSFGQKMQVHLINRGPVTLILETGR